jgi:hypothetical protein
MTNNPIRIKTKGEGYQVYTLYCEGKWITVMSSDEFGTRSCDAANLFEAGQNHLQVCQNYAQLD